MSEKKVVIEEFLLTLKENLKDFAESSDSEGWPELMSLLPGVVSAIEFAAAKGLQSLKVNNDPDHNFKVLSEFDEYVPPAPGSNRESFLKWLRESMEEVK